MVVLVTGANGQLGQAIQFISGNYPTIDFIFCDSKTLDITDLNNVQDVFNKFKPEYCINAAAYTAVDKAETETEKAYSINVVGAKNLAEVCKENNAILLHISTDFVFDGTLSFDCAQDDALSVTKGYTETDLPNPTGVYGQTKLDGEKAIQETFNNYFIIRTSWVYSQFANNFMKTMLRLASERDSLSIVNDQIGTPTNAVDLAEVLIAIICHTVPKFRDVEVPSNLYGIYNFSNEGQCSWYDFAKKIFEINNVQINVQPIPTTSFPTPAKRPAYSVLDKTKIKNVFGVEIPSWETSLKNTII